MDDTTNSSYQKQADVIRTWDAAKRFRLLNNLTRFTIVQTKKHIKDLHPHLTDREIDLKFVEQHYGEDLAAKLASSVYR